MNISIEDRIKALNESTYNYYLTTPYNELRTHEEKLVKQALLESMKFRFEPHNPSKIWFDVDQLFSNE